MKFTIRPVVPCKYCNLLRPAEPSRLRCPRLESTSNCGTVGCCRRRTAEPKTGFVRALSVHRYPMRYCGIGVKDEGMIKPTLFPSALFPHHARSHTISVVLQTILHRATQKWRFSRSYVDTLVSESGCVLVSSPDVFESFVLLVIYDLDPPCRGVRGDGNCASVA